MSVQVTVKTLIADDHPLFRAALTQAVQQSIPDSDIIEAQSFKQVSDLVSTMPDLELIFLDLNMPGNDGFYGLTQLRNNYPDILIIMVSATEDKKVMRKAIDLGASAFIPKSASLSEINLAVQHVLNGEVWLPDNVDINETDTAEDQVMAQKLEKLSPSQFKVLQMIADGLLNKQIAYELSIQETTVKHHITAIFSKLEVNNRTQAGLIFQQLKQVE